ncbi:MAG: DUF4845 domain-containing protein [Motiliproteus sp.]|nr:DUF4845 domain-containing protein [Motiliproteus sp.]MCW9050708.1 DUF4845 domain-containing protein [Motiliproteus sp.]
MKLSRNQQGWTFLGVLTVLIVAGIFVSIGFKLTPAYTDHRTLKSLMTDTIRDRSLLSESKREIELSVIKRLRLNNMKMPKEFMKIEKDKGTVKLIVDYVIRVPIFYNVDALMTFKETYEGQELE